MTDRSATHATFSIERIYGASPRRVFAAWADPKARAQWEAIGEGFETSYQESDFRVGGRDVSRFHFDDGSQFVAEARYEDIVPEARIVYAYSMAHNGTRISVSLTTVEMKPVAKGTRLILTEQMTVLDDGDKPEYRQRGISSQLDQLGHFLEQHMVN
jgi:uncharacterized protein YndB with AHSA1/START domain